MSTPPPADASSHDGHATPMPPMPPARRRAWKLTRNCAMAPATFFWNIGAVGAGLSAVGAAFWLAGYPVVMLFCGVQLAAWGIAALAYARHAADGEHVHVDAGKVRVETRCGSAERVVDFQACWLRIESDASGALMLRSGREALPVGTHLSADRRKVFAEEFAASIGARNRRAAS